MIRLRQFITVLAATLITLPVWGAVELGTHTDSDFGNYWYTDGAEISRFALTQARYGELHKGDATMVFVTEKLRSDIQIKADDPADGDLPVLKLNIQRKFYTGIYPYAVMTSVFSPVDIAICAEPAKITTSAQEWCGHVYTHMNLRGDAYKVAAYSYFEKEGDRTFSVAKSYSEDGLFNLIRLAPEKLPLGEFNIIPGTLYSRMMHRPLAVYAATASLAEEEGQSLEGHALVSYTLRIPSEKRTLVIVFERDYPHRIERWEDTYPSLAFAGSKMLTTTAVRTHTIKSRYWNHNRNRDLHLLNELGLTSRP